MFFKKKSKLEKLMIKFKSFYSKHKKAFTLIELIIVIANELPRGKPARYHILTKPILQTM